MDTARDTAERVARVSYGRLVAYLSSRSRDIAAAEDALSDAFRTALEVWPERGVPDRPEAWLLTAARRRLGAAQRHGSVQLRAEPDLILLVEEPHAAVEDECPDRRLNLMFVCAHPAIDADIRTPLMLQTVLGIEASRIAAAFLVAPAAMAQRLVRAKSKIRNAGIGFALPGRAEVAERAEAVLAAIYAAYGTGWEDVLGADEKRKGLADEALFLGRLVVELMPDMAEARGLLALMLHCEARKPARRGADGSFIPLGEQDVTLWSQALIVEAEREMTTAAKAAVLGRFQLEAAVQSVHAQRAVTGKTNWRALMFLYDLLAEITPTIGILVSRAVAHSEGETAKAGLHLLDELDPKAVLSYQPYWAARAHLLARSGQAEEAYAAYERAIGLAEDSAIRVFLRNRSGQLPLPQHLRVTSSGSHD